MIRFWAALGLAFGLAGSVHAQPVEPAPPAVALTAPPIAWAQASSMMTRLLETAAPSSLAVYTTMAGDKDKQGLLMGALQWNFGQGTIADLIDRVPDADALAATAMPFHGADFVKYARMSRDPLTRPEALVWARSVQTDGVIHPDFAIELEGFLGDPAMVAAQDAGEQVFRASAWNLATKWSANLQGRPGPRFSEYAFFYDMRVQAGARYLDEIEAVMAKLATFKAGETRDIDFISRARTGAAFVVMKNDVPCAIPTAKRPNLAAGHVWDGQANCAIWRAMIAGGETQSADRELLVLAFLRAYVGSDEFAVNLFNRKGLFATGRGLANGRSCDFRILFAALDAGEAVRADQVSGACRPPKPGKG